MPRWSKILIGVVVGLALLVGAFFLADGIIRGIAQDRIASEITNNLPDSVDADFDVQIAGASVIVQYLGGRFEQVTLRDDTLRFDGMQAAVTLEASGIPTDFDKPIENLAGTIVLDQAAVDLLWQKSGQEASLVLEKGTVAYDGSLTVLGFTVGYRVTAAPEAAGDRILLRPKDAALTTAIGSLDLSGLIETVLGGEPVALCVAEYLPSGVELDSITVTPDAATIHLAAEQLVVSGDALAQTGSCTTP